MSNFICGPIPCGETLNKISLIAETCLLRASIYDWMTGNFSPTQWILQVIHHQSTVMVKGLISGSVQLIAFQDNISDSYSL